MSIVLIVFSSLLAIDFRIPTGSSFATTYTSAPLDGNYIFDNGTFFEGYVKVTTSKLALIGAINTIYNSTSGTCAFEILIGVAIKFQTLRFILVVTHSQSFFKASSAAANLIDLHFDDCIVSGLKATTSANPVFISLTGYSKILFTNTQIVDMIVGNYGLGGLLYINSNAANSYVLFENSTIGNINGSTSTNGIVQFVGTPGRVNFTLSIVRDISNVGGTAGCLYTAWSFYFGRSTFTRINNVSSGCLFCYGTSVELTVIQSSFNIVTFRTRGGAVYFYGLSHAYTDVNFTTIHNASSSADVAGIYSNCRKTSSYIRCNFIDFRGKEKVTILQDTAYPVEIRGCKFSNLHALHDRPAGVECLLNTVVNVFDSEFEYISADFSSAVFHTECPMNWNSCVFKHIVGSDNGSVACQRGALSIDNTTFLNATSNKYGAVTHWHSGTVSFTRSIFQNCNCKNKGGAVYSSGSGFFFSNCFFLNNRANASGGGNDIYFTSYSSSTLKVSNFYGCCSTSNSPRVNSVSTIAFLPTCTFGIKYVNKTGGKDSGGCGQIPTTPCNTIYFCGSTYSSYNPIEMQLSPEIFLVATGLSVAARTVDVRGSAVGRTTLMCAGTNQVLFLVVDGHLKTSNITFDAVREASGATLSTTAITINGTAGQATVIDCTFTHSKNMSEQLYGPIIYVNHEQALLTCQRVTFKLMNVLNNSPVSIKCYLASFVSCEFYSLRAASEGKGGAVTFTGGYFQMSQGAFRNCSSGSSAGALDIANSSFVFDSIVFENCSGVLGGAVLYSAPVTSDLEVRFILCQFLSNKASTPRGGNDIRDENGAARYSWSNIVDCCSNGLSTDTIYRFSVGSMSSPSKIDERLPMCYYSPCAGQYKASSCPKECSWVGGVCLENNCTRLNYTETCPSADCVMFYPGTPGEFCYLDMCKNYRAHPECERNLNCLWKDDKCQIHECTTIPGDACPLSHGCMIEDGVCVINPCPLGGCVPPEMCSSKTSPAECAAPTDPTLKCVWAKNKCNYDPCPAFSGELSCKGYGCTWRSVPDPGRCEWNPCVFVDGEDPSTTTCYTGCRRDPLGVCTLDICASLTETQCIRTDCVWNNTTGKCEWNECVRLHDEADCYARCFKTPEGKCISDGGCSDITTKTPCVAHPLCLWIGENYRDPTRGEPTCVRNYCENREPCFNGCKLDSAGTKCMIDECWGLTAEEECPAECTWNTVSSLCETNICTRVGNAVTCSDGCFNSSNVCIIDPCYSYKLKDPCDLNGCTWTANPMYPTSGLPGTCKGNNCIPTLKENLPGCNPDCRKNTLGVCVADPCLGLSSSNCGNCSVKADNTGCEHSKCTPLPPATTCPPGCVSDKNNKCLPDECSTLSQSACEANSTCLWSGTSGCIWNSCINKLITSTQTCSDGSCVYYKAKLMCIPNPCNKPTQGSCLLLDCVWNLDTRTCEYHDCVRISGETDCSGGTSGQCVKDVKDKCKVNPCKNLATKSLCDNTDCRWNDGNKTCDYHPCVREQDETYCYDGCKFLKNKTCTLDICAAVGTAESASVCPRDCLFDPIDRMCTFQPCLRPAGVDTCPAPCVLNKDSQCMEDAGCTLLNQADCLKFSLCEWDYKNKNCVDNVCNKDCDPPCKSNFGGCVRDNCSTEYSTKFLCGTDPKCMWDVENETGCIFNPCTGASCMVVNSTCKPDENRNCRPDVCTSYAEETRCLKDLTCVWDGTLCKRNPCVNFTVPGTPPTCLSSLTCVLDNRSVCVENRCPDYTNSRDCYSHRPAICVWNHTGGYSGTGSCEYNKCAMVNVCTGSCVNGPISGPSSGPCVENICSKFHYNRTQCNLYPQCYFDTNTSRCLPNVCWNETYISTTNACSNDTKCEPTVEGTCKPNVCSDYKSETYCTSFPECMWHTPTSKCKNNPCVVERSPLTCPEKCGLINGDCFPDQCPTLSTNVSCRIDPFCYFNISTGKCEFNPCLKEANTNTSCGSSKCQLYSPENLCYPDPCYYNSVCHKDCEQDNGTSCDFQSCVRFFNETVCYVGCEMNSDGRCIPDNCRNHTDPTVCVGDDLCLWDSMKCIVNNCSSGCTTGDSSCTEINGKCLPNICYNRNKEECDQTDCEWKGGKCEYHSCVRSSNKLKCYAGCELDNEMKCTNDTCSYKETSEECTKGDSDCIWDGSNCTYHKCVRLHGENFCYPGCVMNRHNRCVENKCYNRTRPEDCPKDCIWNYATETCDAHICVREGSTETCPNETCKENSHGDCIPEDQCTINNRFDCENKGGCYWNEFHGTGECLDNDCTLKGIVTCSTGCVPDKTETEKDICVPDPCYKNCSEGCTKLLDGNCTINGSCVRMHAEDHCPDECIADHEGVCIKDPCIGFPTKIQCPEECVWVVASTPWVTDKCTVGPCTRLRNESECYYPGCVRWHRHEEFICVVDPCIEHTSKRDCPKDCKWNINTCEVTNCTMLNGDECLDECKYNGVCTDSPCSDLTDCAAAPGCKTNVDKTAGADKCVDDPCYKQPNAGLCKNHRCAWIDNHCEDANECFNSQTLKCRDGCFPDSDSNTLKCIPDPCAGNSNQSECAEQGNPSAGYECQWNRTNGVCRAMDICAVPGSDECSDKCEKDEYGKCRLDVCRVAADREDYCNYYQVCSFLGGACRKNKCITNGSCPRGCEINDMNTCFPDVCVRQHYPNNNCTGSTTCVAEKTNTWGETCVYDPDKARESQPKKKSFPYWVLLVGLLIIAAAGVAVGVVALYVWQKRKNEKAKMSISDVAADDLGVRDADETSAVTEGNNNTEEKLIERQEGGNGSDVNPTKTKTQRKTSSKNASQESFSTRRKSHHSPSHKKKGHTKKSSRSPDETGSLYSKKTSRSSHDSLNMDNEDMNPAQEDANSSSSTNNSNTKKSKRNKKSTRSRKKSGKKSTSRSRRGSLHSNNSQ